MASQKIYSTECMEISADNEKKHVHIELSSSGYRPKYVSLFIDTREELEQIIAALQQAKEALI